jgi:DNA mismatch repair protein MutS
MARARARAEPRYGELVAQYLALRDQQPGILLLFRVGSFYEVLFEDAELVARELGLKLGQRPSGGTAEPVPQCGFAAHALDTFLPRLLARGYRVAVCEEDQEQEETGSVRQRTVVRTLTPGTVSDPVLLAEDRPTYLVAMTGQDGRLGLAWTDVAAGEFQAGEFDPEAAAAELQRLAPAEVLLPAGDRVAGALAGGYNVTGVEPVAGAAEVLRQAYPDAALADLPLAQAASGVIVRYLAAIRATDEARLETPHALDRARSVQLDAATQRHLELLETEHTRERAGSLLGTLDRAVTPMGRRLLRAWLLRPLTELGTIRVRQAIIGELVDTPALRAALAEQLAAIADLERLAGRVAGGRASADELRALAAVAEQLPTLAQAVATARTSFVRGLGRARPRLADAADRIARTLAEPGSDQPVRPGVSPALDDALARLRDAAAWQQRYLAQLRRGPGLERLKLERTSTQGLFLEVPANTKVPAGWTRRGGLQKVERYSTPELEQHASELGEAEAVLADELRAVLGRLQQAAAAAVPEARDLARHLAAADALLALAQVAAERGWVRPEVDDSCELAITAGRHPVLEQRGAFQPNDATLTARGERDQLVVLTGPNMAGKSTWMRQIALIVLLAQVGSFVPAAAARVGRVDAIFTRIGAVDDLVGGRSTFLVEMLETTAVLRGATDRSLVLLDEVGRGTSTHDGLAIAWAIIEHLASGPARPRAVVATHYHELAALGRLYPQVRLLRARVDEGPEGISFPHRIEAGAADRSFGIEVARLAGLPSSIVERARAVAETIEPLSAEIAQRLGAGPGGGRR